MTKVNVPRLSLTECRNDREKQFLEFLNRRAEAGGWYADDFYVWDDRVVIAVCARDLSSNLLLRTLRVDFDGYRLAFGPDETHQYATDLSADRPGVTIVTDRAPQELADIAADWLEREMIRPIVRNQWFRLSFNRTAWVLQDTGEPLVVSHLGRKINPSSLGAPTETVKVWPHEN
jgi:hypothetical protein